MKVIVIKVQFFSSVTCHHHSLNGNHCGIPTLDENVLTTGGCNAWYNSSVGWGSSVWNMMWDMICGYVYFYETLVMGVIPIWKYHLTSIGIPMIKLRCCQNSLIFMVSWKLWVPWMPWYSALQIWCLSYWWLGTNHQIFILGPAPQTFFHSQLRFDRKSFNYISIPRYQTAMYFCHVSYSKLCNDLE